MEEFAIHQKSLKNSSDPIDIQNMELAIAPTVADAGLETQGLEALSILSALVPRIQRIAKHET